MKIFSVFLLLSISIFSCQEKPSQVNEPTTFIFVRHAEKVLDGSKDPLLTEQGYDRANRLRDFLQRTDLNAIYTTSYQRNILTVQPTAELKNMVWQTYETHEGAPFLARVLDEYPGGTVLVAGHSNTTPTMVNLLTGLSLEEIADQDYNNIFIVTTNALGEGKLLTLYF